jgi:opacity protein-like surface antigen
LDGAVFGGQIGGRYMWTTGGTANVVGGLEFQGFGSDISGSNEINILGEPYAPKLHTSTDIDDLLLAKLKLGFAIDRVWLFGTVGWASANISPSASLNLGDIYVPVESCEKECGGGSAKFKWQDDRRQNGVVFGAGANFALTDSIILGVEWNHIDLPDVDFSGPVKFQGVNLFPVHAHSDFGADVVMGTVSWNFGGGAMVGPQ